MVAAHLWINSPRPIGKICVFRRARGVYPAPGLLWYGARAPGGFYSDFLPPSAITLRQEKGISQDRLSRLADLSLHTVVTVESDANANPTIETLTKIAQALDVGVDDFIKN